MMMGRNLSRRLWWAAIVAALLMTAATGTLRVLGGRHFITDVVFGAVMGFGFALWSALRNRQPSQSD